MIPVIGVPVVENPFWVKRLIESVDFPVQEFCIINNNGRGLIDAELDEMTKLNPEFIQLIRVVHMPSNLGVSGSWNLIIKSYMMAPFWILVNDDVAFCPGFLKEMYEAATNDPEVGLIHGNSGDFGVGSWDLFLIRDHIIQKFGLFDENLYPAYNEDADYIMRFMHRPIKKIMSLTSNYKHGLGDKDEYYTHGSQTGKKDPVLKEKLNQVNLTNFEYMTQKWGAGWRKCSPTYTPFENEYGGIPISTTTYNLDFVRSKNLGF